MLYSVTVFIRETFCNFINNVHINQITVEYLIVGVAINRRTCIFVYLYLCFKQDQSIE